MNAEPCSVCGGTDVNLVDGFYYCVECGTQDVNVRETVVEATMLGDGTFAKTATKKLTVVFKDGIEMSGEWHKWHAYNFILAAIAEELIALGAKESIKFKVLWIWSKYMKLYQVKEDMGEIGKLEQEKNLKKTMKDLNKSRKNNMSIFESDDNEEQFDKQSKDEESIIFHEEEKVTKRSGRADLIHVTKGLLLTILYVALNLDQSDLQMSHLFRFVKEGRLSILNCNKFIPKEIKKSSIPHWSNFQSSTVLLGGICLREIAMACFKRLDLGTPQVPNMSKIIDNYVTELCLPNEFKTLVFSLMNLVPFDFLQLDQRSKNTLALVPDFEGVAMSYVIVALKMCFGLDCDYEQKLSDSVDKINEQENYPKSFKLGSSSLTDRLFSFREWCSFLQYRKIMVCKYFLPMAQHYEFEVDDHVFMEHLGERHKSKIELTDEVTMDILNKIPLTNVVGVIPKAEFPPTLTPMSTYTDVIIEYIQDPDIRLLLSEDFKQYSLKYACEELSLSTRDENMIKGVNESNKTINRIVKSAMECTKADFSMVFVKNCENQNWLKSKVTLEKVDEITEELDIDQELDHGYGSNGENLVVNSERQMNEEANHFEEKDNTEIINASTGNESTEVEKELEKIEEEDLVNSIFDDQFNDLEMDIKSEVEEPEEDFIFELDTSNNLGDSKADWQDSKNDSVMSEHIFNPRTFDRDGTIKELVIDACKKYKIPIPEEYSTKEPRKRKSTVRDEGQVKRSRTGGRRIPGEAKKELDRIMTAYYSNMQQDLLNKVTEHVQNLVTKSHVDNADLELNELVRQEMKNGDMDNADQELKELVRLENKANSVPANCDLDELTRQQMIQAHEESSVSNQESYTRLEYTINHDPSVLETNSEGDFNVEELFPKSDPKFDPKTYNIKELFVKFKEEVDFDDVFIFEDPDIDIMISKQINKLEKSNPKELCAENSVIYDSEDELPLREIEEEAKLYTEKDNQVEEVLQPLVKLENISEFKYWCRHYYTDKMRKARQLNSTFKLELKEHFPNSFSFVINECAAMLDSTPYILYKHVQNLEQMIIAKTVTGTKDRVRRKRSV